jgi:hypothetical protein
VTTEAVYAAEEAAFGGTDLDEELDGRRLAEVLATVIGGDWWQSCGVAAIHVRRARADANTSSAHSPAGGCVVIRLARTSTSTVSHELAHALAGVESGHSGTFRAAHVDVLTALAGAVAADRLEQAYDDHGVPIGERRWDRPVRLRGPGFVMT